MSKIEELIQQHCPDGVEWKKLGECLNYEQPTKYIVKGTKYDDTYPTPVLTAGQTFILGYTNEKSGIYQASKENPVIIFDDFTTGFHWVDFDFKVKSSAMKMLRPTCDDVNFRYVYYAMTCIHFEPGTHSRHWISIYSQFEIPVPPIPVQEEIVRILDKFSLLTAELEAELEARRKQYGFYRNQLLSFDSDSDTVQFKKLGEVCYLSTERIDVSLVDENNYVSVENLLQNRLGKTTSLNVPKSGNCIRYEINDILLGNIRPYLKKIWFSDRVGGTNGDVLCMRIKESYRAEIFPRYLYHILASDAFFQYDNQFAKGAKMPRGNKEAIMNYPIPIPPLEEQQRIVDILDRFDALVNDLSAGLPAEIEARRQQYEYYRDRLLTFKRKAE